MQDASAVNPNNIQQGNNLPNVTQSILTGTTGQFGTNTLCGPGNSNTPLPAPGVGNCSSLYGLAGQGFQAKDISGALKTVGQDISNAASSGGGGGGLPIGGIISGIGSLFGLAEGGPVKKGFINKDINKMGYANGGWADSDRAEYDQNSIKKDKGEPEPKNFVGAPPDNKPAKPMADPNVKQGFASGGYNNQSRIDDVKKKVTNPKMSSDQQYDDAINNFDKTINSDEREHSGKGLPVQTDDDAKRFAQGGQAGGSSPQDMHQAGLIQGYLTGAHHQKNYGGTPDTLQQASAEVANMLRDKLKMCAGGPAHMATGGMANGGSASSPDINSPGSDSIMQALMATLRAPMSSTQGQQGASNPATSSQNTNTPPPAGTCAPPGQWQEQGNWQNQANSLSPQSNPANQAQQAPSAPMAAPAASPYPQNSLCCSTTQVPGSNQPIPGQAKGGFMAKQPMMSPMKNNGGDGYAAGGPGKPPMAPPPTGGQQPGMGAPNPACQPGAAPPPGGNQPLGQGQTFQGDGQVKGPGGPTDDAIPAKLSNGEFVMSAPATAFIGVDKLTKMNEQGKGFMRSMQQADANQQQGPAQGGPPPAAPMGPPGAGSGGCMCGPMPAAVAKGGFMNASPMGKGMPMQMGTQPMPGNPGGMPRKSAGPMKPQGNNSFMGM